MEEIKNLYGTLILKDRKELSLNGVKNVLGFDEGVVTLMSELGRVTVEGEGLKIESLTKENGEILITGKISGVYFSEEKITRGVFGRFFG